MMDNALANPSTAATAATQLKALGIRIIALDLTGNVGLTALRSLASKTGDVIVSPGYSFLSTKIQQLATVMCSKDGGEYRL